MTIQDFIKANKQHENDSAVIAMLKFCDTCPEAETCDEYCLKADLYRDSLPL